MLLLFLLFPRIGPLWGRAPTASPATGLSDPDAPRPVAEVALDDRVALRLRFEGAVPPPQSLYFRGLVLAAFDGTRMAATAAALPASAAAALGDDCAPPRARAALTR